MSQYELDLIEDPSMPRQQVASLPADAFEELGDDDLFAELGDDDLDILPEITLGYLSVENNIAQARVIQETLEEFGGDVLRQYGVQISPAQKGGLYVVGTAPDALSQISMSTVGRLNLLVDRDLEFYESEIAVGSRTLLQRHHRDRKEETLDGLSYVVQVTRLMDGFFGIPKEKVPSIPVATFYTAEAPVVLNDSRFTDYLQQRAFRGKGPLTLVQQKGRRGSAEVYEAVRAGVTLDKMLREGASMRELALELKDMDYKPANVLAKYGN